jgi:hypothetical protein
MIKWAEQGEKNEQFISSSGEGSIKPTGHCVKFDGIVIRGFVNLIYQLIERF